MTPRLVLAPLALSLVLTVAAAGCSGSDDSSTDTTSSTTGTTSTTAATPTTAAPDTTAPDTTEPPTVAGVRAAASAAMAEVQTVLFTVERSGGEVTIDDGGLLVFESADARYAAPDSVDAVVTVSVGGNRLEVGAIAIAGRLWLTDPISGAWQDATGTVDFDPAKIFDPTTGIATILADGLTDVVLVDDGDARLHLSATVLADDVTTLTSGLVTEEADADVWIDPVTLLVDEILFDTPVDTGIASWSVRLSDYGADVKVVEPDTGDGG